MSSCLPVTGFIAQEERQKMGPRKEITMITIRINALIMVFSLPGNSITLLKSGAGGGI
jgi:hypothetical protein